MRIDLFIIDPQNSFCKIVNAQQQQSVHDGELCVPNAWDDMMRVSDLVDRLSNKLDDIHITMDSHHLLHIAHPIWFKDNAGNHPNPFTIISEDNGNIVGSDGQEYTTAVPSLFKRTLSYLEELKKQKRYPHCIWPPHCIIGTPGHNIVAPLEESLLKWSQENFSIVDIVTKGSNPHVEHFSAVKAEVPDPKDVTTELNSRFIETLMDADEIVLAGEAGSHCLAHTTMDIANEFQDDSFIKKCVLLTDGTSPVPTFEKHQEDFIKNMTARGMKVSTCKDYLA